MYQPSVLCGEKTCVHIVIQETISPELRNGPNCGPWLVMEELQGFQLRGALPLTRSLPLNPLGAASTGPDPHYSPTYAMVYSSTTSGILLLPLRDARTWQRWRRQLTSGLTSFIMSLWCWMLDMSMLTWTVTGSNMCRTTPPADCVHSWPSSQTHSHS